MPMYDSMIVTNAEKNAGNKCDFDFQKPADVLYLSQVTFISIASVYVTVILGHL